MLCSINDFFIADGTLSGGRSLSALRFKMVRVFDVFIPIGATNPVLFDRNKRRVEIAFTVKRVQSTIADAENYCLEHDETIPRTGDIKLYAVQVGFSPSVVALVVNGELLTHELIKEIGKLTEHQYRIVGSPVFAPTPEVDVLVTEGGDHLVTEGGDRISVE